MGVRDFILRSLGSILAKTLKTLKTTPGGVFWG